MSLSGDTEVARRTPRRAQQTQPAKVDVPRRHSSSRSSSARSSGRTARIAAVDAQAAVPDFLLAILFIVAYAKTRGTPPNTR